MNKAKFTYEEMISRLRVQTYSAPDGWDAIEADLDLGTKISQLKEHKAPEDLWDKIDIELENVPETVDVSIEKQGSNTKYYLLAGLLLICMVVFITSRNDTTEVSYSSEIIETVEVTKPVEGPVNNGLIEAINFINQNDFLYTAKDKLDFEKEMAKLEEAEKELKQMQEQYGVDKNSLKMLAKIEREKAELIKSMIKGA